jgi:coenzyme F420-reducing hydrogenase delta subunit/ferredoxin
MYEPKIIGFLCTWCSYTGADTAGISRLKYPANLRAVRVPCSGRVSPELVLRAFEQGADGVLILGCHIGECHYESGNHRTAKRVPALHALLAFTGLEPERLRLDWVSASEGDRFARIVKEFTEVVRALGPARWSVTEPQQPAHRPIPGKAKPAAPPVASIEETTREIQNRARELLSSGQVSCVIGYELGTRGRTRPAFVRDPGEVERLVWNQACSHNLTRYLPQLLGQKQPGGGGDERAAVVVKPCDSRAINVQLVEHLYRREQVYAIGITCPGVVEEVHNPITSSNGGQKPVAPGPLVLQDRCLNCSDRVPLVFDSLVKNEPETVALAPELRAWLPEAEIERLQGLTPAGRAEFWLSQFDRCIRCYACRQACPMCNCPTCLYERDDSLWVGMGIRVNEKRAFHLGRAYHLAGRCVGCDECERACPMDIPIGLLNRLLAQELERAYGFRAGFAPVPPPFVTVLGGEEG